MTIDPTQYRYFPQNTTQANSIAIGADEELFGYTCFDISSECDMPNYMNTDDIRLNNIINAIYYSNGNVGQELLDKVEALCTETGAKIKFVQPVQQNPSHDQSPPTYLFSQDHFDTKNVLYIKIPTNARTEQNTYIYDHEIYLHIKSQAHGSTGLNADDSQKELQSPLRRITLKDGLKRNGQVGLWLKGKITVDGYVVAHELSHAAACLECRKKDIEWTTHKGDTKAILQQCKMDDNEQNRKSFLEFFPNAEEARNTILGKKFENICVPGECDFFKEITDKKYLLLHTVPNNNGRVLSPTDESLNFLSRIFDYVNTPPPDCPCCCAPCLLI